MKETVKSTTKIRITKLERISLPKGFRKYCERCGGDGIFHSIDQAVFHFGLTARLIFRLIEANRIHFHESADGAMFVCAGSIADFTKDAAIIQDQTEEEI